MRGDRPLAAGPQLYSEDVYPACAGIDLPMLFRNSIGISLPRMRGIDLDRPPYYVAIDVYPACAGIDRGCL